MNQDKQHNEHVVEANKSLSQPAHSLPFDAVLSQLASDPDDGLTGAEAKKRLEQYGENVLEGDEGVSIAKIIIRQIANAMMLVSRLTPIQVYYSSAEC